ncbi:MAG TPA: helix-turn-helix domain-containing protein, partial [Enteractinococcus helveticum]
GSIIIPVPLNLTASQQTFSTLQLLHIPTKIRAETIFQGIGWVTALKPNDREPTGMPLSLQPTAIDLFFETEDSHAQRIQHVQLALYKNPGHFATLDDWAQRFGISTRSLERSFNHQAGMTFGTWRQALRMHRAIDWLDEGRQVKWISCALGYANVSAFSRAFTKHNGTSARDYQIMARDTVLRLDSTR